MTNFRATGIIMMLVIAYMINPSSALAQDCSEADSNAKLMNYSLYWESFKNKDYETARPYLKWIIACAPGFRGPGKSDDKNFERAVQMYQELSNAAEDPTAKRALLDTALVLLDEAAPTLMNASIEVDEIEWTRNKGRFIQKNAEQLGDLQGEVGGIYRTVFDGNSELLNPISYYVNVIITTYARDDQKDEAVDFMEIVESKYGSDAEVMGIIDGWRDRLFKDNLERITFLEGQLEKNQGDVEIIEQLLELYEAEIEEEGMRDKLSDMLAQMIDVAPTPRIHISAGIMKLNDGDTDGAIEAFKAAEKMPGAEQFVKEINFNIGNAYREDGKLSQARSAYRKVLRADPDFGQAYIEMANLYAEAVRDCGGSKMEREDRAVYWLVADYLDRARRDDSVRNTASRNLQQYKPYFPAAEDLFFKGWKEGESYEINYGCYAWVKETTKVRKP